MNFMTWIYVWIWRLNRDTFIRDLSNSFVRRVGIRSFLEREMMNAQMVKNSSQQAVMRVLLNRLASGEGESLLELLRPVCPKSDAILLATVDDASDKVLALEKMADAISFKKQTLFVLAKNLATPALAVPIVGTICITSADIIKSIEKSAPPGVWVGFNGFIRVLASFITDNALGIMAALIGAVAVLIWSLPRWTGPIRSFIEGAPVYDLYRKYNAAVVMSSLAMMMANNKSMREGLDTLRIGASPWLEWQLRKIVYSLEDNPNDYSTAFGLGLLPNQIRGRLLSLADSVSFEDAMVQLGSSEAAKLASSVNLAAVTLNYTITGFLVLIAIVLSIGQMTIGGAMANQSSPAAMRQSK